MTRKIYAAIVIILAVTAIIVGVVFYVIHEAKASTIPSQAQNS